MTAEGHNTPESLYGMYGQELDEFLYETTVNRQQATSTSLESVPAAEAEQQASADVSPERFKIAKLAGVTCHPIHNNIHGLGFGA